MSSNNPLPSGRELRRNMRRFSPEFVVTPIVLTMLAFHVLTAPSSYTKQREIQVFRYYYSFKLPRSAACIHSDVIPSNTCSIRLHYTRLYRCNVEADHGIAQPLHFLLKAG